MNHPSEWTRYYDAPQGTYRYKHKGTGVVRDTLMAIGRLFTKKAAKEKARQALKRAVKEASKKVVEKAAEKGADKIQAVLRGKKKTPLSTESQQKLKMLTKSSKLSGDSRKKLHQILNPGRSAKLKVNQYLAEN